MILQDTYIFSYASFMYNDRKLEGCSKSTVDKIKWVSKVLLFEKYLDLIN